MRSLRVSFCLLFFLLLAQVLPAQAADIHLSAAASLKEALDQLTDRFARKNPGVRFIKNYGASGALARQLEQGAPVDLFISANVHWLQYLEQKQLLVSESVSEFSRNTLVFIGRPDLGVSSMKELLSLNRIAIGSPKSVPAGEYAVESLKKATLLEQIEKKLVMAKDVRECLLYTERGDVEGGFVYHSDALLAKKSKILFAVPQDLYGGVTYPMGLTPTGSRKRDVAEFYRYLKGSEAQSVLAKFGFQAPLPITKKK